PPSAEREQIFPRWAAILRVPIEEEGAREIARRSRGTPRVANRLLRRVRDYAQVKADGRGSEALAAGAAQMRRVRDEAQVKADGRVSKALAEAALKMLDVDALGLDMMDRKLLLAVIEKF